MANNILRGVDRKLERFPKNGNTDWVEDWIFIQGADTQFGMIEGYFERKAEAVYDVEIKWDKEIALTNIAVKKINEMSPKPEFFVVCGDLIDAMPNDPPNRPHDKKNRIPQIESFKECFKNLDIPLICVCGNHDVGDVPTVDSIQDYRNHFGDDYFVFYCKGVMFIVLNSQYYECPDQLKNLAEEQEEWLDELLKEAKKFTHAVIFQHIPWFLNKPDEEKEYFNIENKLRKKMLSKFHSVGIKAIFCGHYHRNAGGMYKDMELIVTSAIGAQLGNDKSGLRTVQVKKESINHQYYALEDIPKSIN